MKLMDQVFKVYSPSEWNKHLPIDMPSFWSEALADVTAEEIETINWSSAYLLVARCNLDDQEDLFVSDYGREVIPDAVRVTFREHADYARKRVFSAAYASRTCVHSCGCCITLFYKEES